MRGSAIVRPVSVLFILVFYALLFAPLVVVIGASFDGAKGGFLNFPPRDLSLVWYRNMPADYLRALLLSCELGASAALISTVLGIAAALGLVRGRVMGKALIVALLRAPLQIPAVVIGLGFLQFYYLLGSTIGINPGGTFVGLLIGHVFITLPFVIGTVVAVLQRFSMNLEEAAISLGATYWGTFRRVTLPVILPGVWSGALYAFIISFGDVPVSMLLTGENVTPFPVAMFNAMQFDFNPAILAISSLVLVGSCVVIWLLQRVLGLNTLTAAGN
jgi:putative spermidine/putrescine transport system permease protein